MSQRLGVKLLGLSLQRLWSLEPSLARSASQMSNQIPINVHCQHTPGQLRYLSRLCSQLSLVAGQLIGQLLCWMCPEQPKTLFIGG